MQIGSVRALRGPSIWAQFPVLEIQVPESPLDDIYRNDPAAFWRRIELALPGLTGRAGNRAGSGSADDDTLPASETPLVRALELVLRELQLMAGCSIHFSRTVPAAAGGPARVVMQFGEEDVARRALQAACEICRSALDDTPIDVSDTVRDLRELDEDLRLGPSTGSIVRAAEALGIPTRRLNTASLVQFGQGSRQRRICAAETDRTSAIAETIAQDKELTKSLLRAVGVPVPKGRPVTSAEEAWDVACEIGVPVVVKPQFGNQGKGVVVNLTTREQIVAAFQSALEYGDSVIVEQFAPGYDHRVLVIGGRVVAAARREPPQVTGDGVHTIAELVEAVNLDPRRSAGHATSLSRIRLDDIGLAMLAGQNFTPDSVPAAGMKVLLRGNGNLSTGGTAADVTDSIHPEVAARAVEAARMIGLNIAGVDVVALDISRPLEEQRGVIVEVNAAPGLRMHLEPTSGCARPVGEAIVATLFDSPDDGRIPVVAVTGVNGKTTTTRLIAHLFRTFGKRVGMTCTDGIYLNDRRIDTGDCSGPRSARAVLANPQVDAAVLETARGGILREGLGFDRCDVAVVTNIGEGDHLGMGGIDTLDELARVKRVIVEAVSPAGAAVLNADDPLVVRMSSCCPGRTVFFSRSEDNPVVQAHRQREGRVVFVSKGAIVAAERDWEVRVASLDAVPMTLGGRVGFQVENALAAAAAAWSAGIPLEVIRAGLESFVTDCRHAPARFNLFEVRGATVIIDYGHNSSALLSLVDAIEHLPHQRRLIMFSAAGDRRDEDIIRQCQVIGDGFDHVLIFEDQCTRGRAPGAVKALMRSGFILGRRVTEISERGDEMLAVEGLLSMLRPGDVALVLADQVEKCIDFVQKFVAALSPPAALAAIMEVGSCRPHGERANPDVSQAPVPVSAAVPVM